jgi:hypothetical protein
MLRYTIAIAALISASPLAFAEPVDHGDRGPPAASGAGVDRAPGQMKGEGGSAKDFSPGHLKDGSPARAGERNGIERKSENSQGMKARDADRNAKNDKELGAKADRNAQDDQADRHNKMKNAQSRPDADNGAASGKSEGTEGRSGSKGSISSVTDEQRTRVRSVFSQHRVAPVKNLNIAVNIGVALPHTVHLYPVPEDIVLIVPEYRGYEYIVLDDDRVAIVDPDTFEVVDIIVIA